MVRRTWSLFLSAIIRCARDGVADNVYTRIEEALEDSLLRRRIVVA